MMNEDDKRFWLRATLTFMIGDRIKWNYLDVKDPEKGRYNMLSNSALQNDMFVRKFHNVSSKQIDSIIDLCNRNDISIVTPSDDVFPTRFRHMPDPPSVLFVLGDISVIAEMPSMAVVGARECCEYSERLADDFSYQLAESGINIISGMARGIDSAAHMAAMRSGGHTTAILGCGVLYDYPKGSARLKRIIADRGAVMSEYLPTTRPAGEYFKVRNRLIAALCDCVVVVEASKKSGSINTAGLAADLGKDVFVIPPHDLYDPAFDGQSGLLLDGACPAITPGQLIEYFIDRYDLRSHIL